MAVLLVVAGTIFGALSGYQKSYGSTMLKADMHEGARGAAELMVQEIGQAGAVPIGPAVAGVPTPTTLTAAVNASTLAHTVNVASSASIFVNENLQIHAGAASETVVVTDVDSSSIKAIFTKNHAANAIVAAIGVFPQGLRQPLAQRLCKCLATPMATALWSTSNMCATL